MLPSSGNAAADLTGGIPMNQAIGIFRRLGIALSCVAMAGTAWAEHILIQFAGTGFDTSVENGGNGPPIDMSIAEARGSFGAKRAEISVEFDYAAIDCPDGHIGLSIAYSSSVVTYGDQSQTYGFSNSGWMCLSLQTGHYFGEAYGVFIGGTGRFAGATGDWVSSFQGDNLEPPNINNIGFRSITGTIKGTVNFN